LLPKVIMSNEAHGACSRNNGRLDLRERCGQPIGGESCPWLGEHAGD
jgi:hypothetical protein